MVSISHKDFQATVTINITGHITSVPGALSTAFTAGETFTIHYSYDTTTCAPEPSALHALICPIVA